MLYKHFPLLSVADVDCDICVEEPETPWTSSNTTFNPTAHTQSWENCTSKWVEVLPGDLC